MTVYFNARDAAGIADWITKAPFTTRWCGVAVGSPFIGMTRIGWRGWTI